jgi:uncharacterized repeat protein (TIGR02543 family)
VSIFKKRILFIFAFLFMAMTLVACTGDSVRVVVVYGEEQMFVGEEQTLSATVRPISFDQTVYWSTSDSTIATVDKNGLVRALKPGTVYIEAEAKADSNVTKRFKIEITYRPPQSMALIAEETMGLYEEQTITVNIEPENAADLYTLTSSDPEIIEIDGNKLLAKGLGRATITVRSDVDPEVFAEATVRVILKEYPITYHLFEGTNHPDNPSSFTALSDVITFKEPTRDKYQFLGWFTSSDYTTPITFINPSELKAPIELYAKWEKLLINYTITYELNGGELPDGAPETFTELEEVELPVPTRESYLFEGWFTNPEFTGEAVTKIPVGTESNQVFYAKWKAAAYSIIYNLNGGSFATDPKTEFTEFEGFALPIPTRPGYNFLGWYVDEELTGNPVSEVQEGTAEDLVFYAKWEAITHAITYNLNGGSWTWEVNEVTNPGAGIDQYTNLPEIFMADFYQYLKDNNLLTSPIVASKLHKTTWADFSANYGDPVAIYNHTSSNSSQTNDGYSQFFYDSATGDPATGELLTVVGGFLGTEPYKTKYATLVKHLAYLQSKKYTVHFWEGASGKSLAGFVLDGYFYGTQGAGSGDFYNLRKVIPNTNLGYKLVDGVLTPYEVEYAPEMYYEGVELLLPAPVKEGYFFVGWFDNPELEGEKVVAIRETDTTDKVFYAKWEEVKDPEAPVVYSITYVLNGGELAGEVPVEFTELDFVTLPIPTKEGFNFLGWFTDPEFGGEAVTEIPVGTSEDQTFYAKWEEIPIEVTDTLVSPRVEGLNTGDKLSYNGTEYVVGVNVFGSFAEAINATVSGKVYVEAGVYFEDFTINKSNIELIGPNHLVDPNKGERIEEAIIAGKVTVNGGISNVSFLGLAFTGDATIVGSGTSTKVLANLTFSYNYVYNTTPTTTAWVETNAYNQGFIYFQAAMNYEMQSFVFTNNLFDTVHDVNISLAYIKDVLIKDNVFKDFGRDAVRFNHGGYNYGDIIIERNDFVQSSLGGYNGIYFRIYGGPAGSTTNIVIKQNYFRLIGVESAGLYSGAISARNYQEYGTDFTITGNIFEKCLNYIRIRNNATTANHASYQWVANINYNAFLGLPQSYYYANRNQTDGAATNPALANLDNNYYEDDDGNVITDLSPYAGFFKEVASNDNPLADISEVPSGRFSLSDLEEEAEKILGLAQKQVVLNYMFPKSTVNGVSTTWAYKEGEDPSIHNLETGVRQKEMLTYQPRTLVLTLQYQDLVVTKELTVNFGVVQEGQVGLFYRNTPVAMSKDETGPADSFIGWNGYTITSGDKVLFIAMGMTFTVTTAEEAKALGNLTYSSVALLVINTGTSAITFNNSEAPGLAMTTYCIIGADGKVKVTGSPATITLEPGDAVYSSKYLDTLITGNPLFPAGNLAVGTEMIIKDWTVDPDAVEYTITYHLDGGENKPGNPSVYTRITLPLELAEPTKENHIFRGWYDNPEFAGEPISVIPVGTTGNIDLYAKWEEGIPPVKFTITYHVNGGVLPSSYPKEYTDQDTEPTVLPIPTRQGYKFLGWFLSPELAEDPLFEIEVGSLGNIVLYAGWEEIIPEGTYTITYHLNGGIWGYPSKNEMLTDLLTDFYNFLLDEGTITSALTFNTFAHGEGKTSGFLGTWYSYCNPGYPLGGVTYPKLANKFHTSSTEMIEDSAYFLNHPAYYNKWINFFIFFENEFVKAVNNTQTFFADPAVGALRFAQYAGNIKPAAFVTDATMQVMPDFTPTKLRFTAEEDVIILPKPVRIGYTFEGWYDNPVFGGQPIRLISPGTEGNQVFYAKWSEELDVDIYVRPESVGENVYQTITEALEAAVEGSVIYVATETYNESFTISKNNITLIGPFAGVDPNKNVRGTEQEAVLTGTITIAQGVKGLTIDGFTFTGGFKLVGPVEGGMDTFVFKNNYVHSSTLAADSPGIINLTITSDSAKNRNFYFLNNLFTTGTQTYNPRYIRGGNIENLWLLDNVFEGGRVTSPGTYTDGLRLAGTNDSTTNGIGIAGVFIVRNNEFKNFGQRGLWVRRFTATKVEVINNLFENCGDQSYGGGLDLSNWGGGSTIKTSINIKYNTFKNFMSTFGIRLGNAGATPENYKNAIHYNKFMGFASATYQFISNMNQTSTALLDARYNYYDGNEPVAAQFIGVGTFSDYYLDEASVPKLSQEGTVDPTEIVIGNPIETLVKFTGHQLNVNVLPTQASDKRLAFATSNPNIVSVSTTGYLTAVGDGTATITITSVADPSISVSFEVTVTTPTQLEVRYVTNSFVDVGGEISLSVRLYPQQDATFIWSSSDEEIATVVDGLVVGHKAGIVTITATVEGREDLTMSVEVTVIDTLAEMDALIQYFAEINRSEVLRQDKIKVTGFQFIYGADIYGSVSDYLFEQHYVKDQIVPETNSNRPGTLLQPGIMYITIHDTASAAASADAQAHANYMTNNTDGSTSWHYTVDEKIAIQHIPDEERANHAGDGSRPYGQPWDKGIGGGNTASIGIETCVNLGSDLYRTWQRTAKLVANLLVKHDLDVSAVKQHYDFSTKNCPQTMRDNNLYDNFMRLVEAEYHILKNFDGYEITFESHNPDILDNNGRIISRPVNSTTVSYTVTVSKDGVSQSITLHSVVSGIYNTRFVTPVNGYPDDFIYTVPTV